MERVDFDFMESLTDELKAKLIKALNLDSITPDAIQLDEPLFGTGLGLDSIDALDLVSMLEREYGILVEDMEVARKAFASFRSLEDFVRTHRK
jgi:acyl carrier protein